MESASRRTETVNKLDSSIIAKVMQRTWLDNALIIEGTKVLNLADQITNSDSEFANCLEDLSKDQSLKNVIQKEWEIKSLALDELITNLQAVSEQIRKERQMLWRR